MISTRGQQILGFAHRGAPRHRTEHNTLPAFERALALGASGIETDIGLTADGIPVLLHAGLNLRNRLRVGELRRSELPPYIPTLQDLYDTCGADFDLSLDMAHPQAADAVVRIASEFGATNRLWLTYWRLPTLALWRDRWPRLRLVYPTMPILPGSVGRLLPRLATEKVDVLNVHHRVCTTGLARAAHAHGLQIFAWGVRDRTALHRVLQRGIDGVYCDDVESMVCALSGHRG